jgi:hypothetical protein
MKSSPEHKPHELETLSALTSLDLPTMGKRIWIMMGITFVVTAIYLHLGDPLVIDGASKAQVVGLFLLLGAGILFNTLIIEPLKQKSIASKKTPSE